MVPIYVVCCGLRSFVKRLSKARCAVMLLGHSMRYGVSRFTFWYKEVRILLK